MQCHHRPIAALLLSCVISVVLLAACGGDDASPIAPEPLTIDEALAELDSIEEMIRSPDQELIAELGIDPAAVDIRINGTLDGVTNAPGLNEVRRLLAEATPENEDDKRILAGETLYNITFATIAPAFGGNDDEVIPEDEIAELDPLHVWAASPEDGLPVTAVWKDAVVRIISLWHRL